jgi:hypothetical protein
VANKPAKKLKIPLSFEQTVAAALETPPERKPKPKKKSKGDR